jgi:hypothetical protein
MIYKSAKTIESKLLGILRLALPATVGCVLFSGCAFLAAPPADPALESARVRLTEGTITRDHSLIQPILAPDFAWREDNAPLDEEPYDFWNRHHLWQELGAVIKLDPVPKDGLMVAPIDSKRAGYSGPRVAWRKVGGEWKLAYFYGSIKAVQ